MKRIIVLAACATAAFIAPELHAQASADTAAAKFYLDYNVPESPAFALLGATPSNVLRGAASKPLVVSLLSQAGRGEKIASGIAIDVAPYGFWGRFKNVKEYQDSPVKRFFANVLTSIATVQAPNDSNSVIGAIGLRATFHDSHDVLLDDKITKELSEQLVPVSIECPKVPGTNICQAGTSASKREIDVAPVYAAARQRLARQKGWAASVGGAVGSTLRGGILRGDSLQQRTGNAWIAATRYMSSGQELLFSGQFVRDTLATNHTRVGTAYRMQSSWSSIAAELAYDNQAGGVLPGLNTEFRVLQRVTLIAAVVTDAPAGDAGTKKVRFRTSLRWAATEGF